MADKKQATKLAGWEVGMRVRWRWDIGIVPALGTVRSVGAKNVTVAWDMPVLGEATESVPSHMLVPLVPAKEGGNVSDR